MHNKDLIEGKYVEDAIGFSSYGWDMPDPLKPSVQPMDGKKRASIYTPIPFGCMVPLGVENLICAGRCISSDREALGALRVMAPCMAMGEAAGAAAAQNFANSLSFADTDVFNPKGVTITSIKTYGKTRIDNTYLLVAKVN